MSLMTPLFTQDQSYTAWNMRRQMASMFSAGVVNPATDFLVTPASGLQVQVSGGAAYVAQSFETDEPATSDEGVYFEFNDAPMSPYNTILAPVLYPRVDQVILRIYDVTEQSLSGSSKGQIEWLQGAETSGATLINLNGHATLPANSLLLAYVLQTVGESTISGGNILQVAPQAITNSGVVRFGLAAAKSAAASVPRQIYLGSDNEILYVSNGSLWIPYAQQLTPVPVTSNVTAADRQMIQSNAPGATLGVLLPAPTKGTFLGVFTSAPGTSGTTPTTVTASSGAIYGRGLGGAGSVVMGTPNTCLMFFADGTNWDIVSGEQDTGWIPVSPLSFVAPTPGTFYPSVRLRGDTVTGKGGLQNAGSGGVSQWFEMPTALLPNDTASSLGNVSGVIASSYPSSLALAWGLISTIFTTIIVPSGIEISLDNVTYQIS